MDIARFRLSDAPADFVDDPYPYYAALREGDPVHEMESGSGAASYFVSRYDDVVAVYRHAGASSDKKIEFKPKFGDSPLYEHHTTSLVFNDPPLHTRVRSLIMGALNQRAIARMEQGVWDLVNQLIDALPHGEPFDFIESFAARIPVEVIGNLLDIPKDHRGPLRGWSTAILSGLEPRPSAEMLERGNRAVSHFKDYLARLVEERRRTPGDPESDVLTRLVQDKTVSALELYHNCIFLLNAGHETTTNLIGNGLWLLLRHEDQLDRMRKDPSLVSASIEEMLRYEGPIQLNNRRLKEPVEIGGKTLPEGSLLTLGIGAANRDPNQFSNAERFDVGRKPNRHVAFGHGEHACAGMNVARMEARIAFSRLLQRCSRLELCGAPERDRRIRFRGFRTLPIRI